MFSALGLFCRPGFLSPAECAEIRTVADQAMQEKTKVVDDYSTALDEKSRSTKRAQLTAGQVASLKERLVTIIPELQEHFRKTLQDSQPPQVLIYGPGDFFEAHRDSSDAPTRPPEVRCRRISVVIFLNACNENASSGTFSGGDLTFYGLVKQPGFEDVGMGIDAEEGLLVAFPSDTYHEVTPVVAGKRYTVVSWYY